MCHALVCVWVSCVGTCLADDQLRYARLQRDVRIPGDSSRYFAKRNDIVTVLGDTDSIHCLVMEEGGQQTNLPREYVRLLSTDEVHRVEAASRRQGDEEASGMYAGLVCFTKC